MRRRGGALLLVSPASLPWRPARPEIRAYRPRRRLRRPIVTPVTSPAQPPPAQAAPARSGPATAGPSSPADGYSARHLTVLEGLEAVRKRPGMYIGSTDGRGLAHCLWEIFDNAVDEALGGHCSRIEVILHADGSAEVRDDGRGIPVDVEPRTALNGVGLVMARLHAGGKFGGGS